MGIKNLMSKKNLPKWLWDWCGTLVAGIRRLTAHDFPALNGLSSQENIHSRTTDISPYTQVGWYDPVWYIDKLEGIEPRCKLGLWIGIAEDVGRPLTWWILPVIAKPRSSVFPFTEEDKLLKEVQDLVAALKAAIDEKRGNKFDPKDMDNELKTFAELNLDLFEDDDEQTTEPIELELAMPEADEFSSPEVFDQYLWAEILMDYGGKSQLGTVKRCAKGNDGNPLGISDKNPILDT